MLNFEGCNVNLDMKLEEIEEDYPNDVYKRRVEVTTRWLKTGRGSWRALCDALRHELVQLAEKLKGSIVHHHNHMFLIAATLQQLVSRATPCSDSMTFVGC